MTEIQMPRLSDTMEEGVITAWHKQVGDSVRRGDVVAEIETDKAVMELEAYDDGVLEKVLVGEGATVPIGTPIAVLGDGSGAAAPVPEQEMAAASEPVPARTAGNGAGVPVPGGRPKASPLAKAVAREHGVDLGTVTGTGPGGRIIRADVDAAIAIAAAVGVAEPVAPQPPPALRDVPAPPDAPASDASVSGASAADRSAAGDVEEIPLSRIRKVTARRLAESKQQVPHFYLTSAIDVTDLVAFRSDLNERLQAAGGPKISVNDLIVKACATALRANPALNVSFAGDKLRQYRRIHLGVAVAVDSGLLVPVIRDADRKSVSELAVEGRAKAARAREGTLTPDEMSGGTFTLSNLGMFGIEQFTAVINPPEAGILAIGAVRDEVHVRDGEFVARKTLRVTLSADHRAVDGAVGARFLQQLTDLLQDPIRVLA